MFPPRLRVNEFIVKKHPLFLANGISAIRKRNKRGREPILLDSDPSRSGLDPSGSLLIDSDLICDRQSFHDHLREHSGMSWL